MAVLDRITIGNKQLIVVDTDPTITGVAAPMGSIIIFDDGSGVGLGLYQKTSVSDTNWSRGITEASLTSISSVGTITLGTWNGSVISTTYTQAQVISVTGTASRITIGGTASNPTIDISSSYAGQATITTLGTITTGVWTGTQIAAANGGTGQTTYTIGDLLQATGATTLSKLAAVATGNALISGGVGTASSWGKIGLTTHISGTLGVGNGGTGVTSFGGTNRILFTTATDTLSSITTANTSALVTSNTGVPSLTSGTTANRVLRTDGTTITFSQVALATDVSGTLPVANGGTNIASYTIGDLIYASGTTTLSKLAAVATGSYLRSTGVGAAPVWSTLTLVNAATKGDIFSASAANTGANLAVGTNGQSLTPDSTQTTGLRWVTQATVQSTPADPGTTTSTTGVMMGLAASITPTKSGTVMIIISGDIDNNTILDGAQVQIRTGTGIAPVNGSALTGTTRGSLIKYLNPSDTRGGVTRVPFTCNALVTGLTVGTAVWIDISLAAITGGTARVRDISISAIEQ